MTALAITRRTPRIIAQPTLPRAVNWDLIEGLVADRVQPDVGEEVPA